MEAIAAKLINAGLAMLMKLVTEGFVARMVLIGLKQLAKSTNNTVDDDIVATVEKCLSRNACELPPD